MNKRNIILTILLFISICNSIIFLIKIKDLNNTIDIKNQRIQYFQNELHEKNIQLHNTKMAYDEYYELFLSCVYPNGMPNYEED